MSDISLLFKMAGICALGALAACGNTENVAETTTETESTTDGNTQSTAVFSISSITPNNGTETGGTSVSVTGDLFESGATVTMGSTACGSVSVSSATTINCTTGNHGSTEIVDVIVANPNASTVTLDNGFSFTSAPAPSVTSISPTTGSVSGSTAVTITGTDFVTAATVSIGGKTCTGPTVVTATQITCTTSARLKETVNVVVTNPDFQTGTLTGGYGYTGAATFTLLQSQVFTSHTTCVGCHGGSGGLTITSYASVVARVVPSDGINSLLWKRIEGTTMGVQMPTSGTPMPLSAVQIDAVKDWIDAGAANN